MELNFNRRTFVKKLRYYFIRRKVFYRNIEYKYRIILSKEKEIREVSGDIFILRKLWMKLNFNKGKSELFHY